MPNTENCFSAHNLLGKIVFCNFNASEFIKFILICFILAFSSLTLIFSQKISFDSEITKSIADEFIDNFKSTYFLEFQKCYPNDKKIKFDTWQGTNRGCGKKNKEVYALENDDDNCKKDEKTFYKISPQNIYNFKGFSLCAKTQNDNNNYYDNNFDSYYNILFSDSVVEENENCPESTKNCGYIDTVNNKLCLKNTSICPISFIQIKDVNSPPPSGIADLKVITGETINFYYSNNPYANTSQIP